MAAHIVKPELLAQEIGQRASVNELAAVIQQPGDIRNGRRLRQRPLDLVLRVHAASMRCARSIVQLYLRVKGSPSLTPQQAAAHTWIPDPATWAAIAKQSVADAATVAISGFAAGNARQPVSRGHMLLHTSADPVGAPIFYRDVPLMPSKQADGVIKPLDSRAVPLIAWRLRDVAETRSRVLLEDMHTCANCHSFSGDGKTLGMDLDGPANDKSLYTIVPVQQRM